MKRASIILAAMCYQLAHAGYVSRDVLVPDEATAIAVAKAVLIPILGKDFENNRVRTRGNAHRFYAVLSGGTWIVEDAPPSRKKWSDPILRVEIDRSGTAFEQSANIETRRRHALQ